MKIKLPNITLLGIDCVNVERLQAAMDISERDIEFGEVKLLTSLPTDDKRLVSIPPITSIEDFSKFCIRELSKYVNTEYVLLVQYDGFILNPESWTPEFLEYDYIGAPLSWGSKDAKNPGFKFTVGNGGFSLRSKKFLDLSAQFANEGKIERFDPEDKALCVWYRDLFEKEGMKYALADLGMRFSVVEDYGIYDKPFGFHGLFNKNMETLITRYPEFPTHFFMPRMLTKRIEKIVKIFKEIAVEGYLEGKNSVWLIFKDEDLENILKRREDLYAQFGQIIGVEESTVIYQTKIGPMPISFYFCSVSYSSTPKNAKKLFG